MRTKIKTAFIIAVVLLLLFWNPATRGVLLYVLPLGSGIDDLIFLALALVVIVLAILSRMQSAENKPALKKQRIVFWSIIAIAVTLAAMAGYMFASIY